MLTMHDIYDKIQRDLDGSLEALCRDIVEFLVSDQAKPLKHITYITLVNGSRLRFEDTETQIQLLKVTDYLSSHRLHLLDMHFQFVENDSSEPVPVDDEEISHALHTGEFYHPKSGQLIQDYNRFLFPFFTPTEALERLHD